MTASPPVQEELVLGIDAGGTKTVAWLARADGTRIGAGTAGPGNPRAVGFERACSHLSQAIALAFAEAQRPAGKVSSAVIGMAGEDRPEEAERIQEWAAQVSLAEKLRVVNDALPVLVAGTPDGWGIALISGTGSIAVGLASDGRTARAGGWGYLIGDEGSAYWIASRGLRAVAQSIDGFGKPTNLVPAFMNRLAITQVAEFVLAIYRPEMDRTAIAALAEVVFTTAEEGDQAALDIVNTGVTLLAGLVLKVAERLDLMEFPLAFAGGVLIHHQTLRTEIEKNLRRSSARRASSIALVPEPVAGAVRMACNGPACP